MAVLLQGLQVAQKEAQIRLLEGRLRQTDMTGSSQNHAILDALREKAESHPELQALIHNVQQGRTQGWRVLVPGMLPVGRGTHTCQHQEAPGGAMAGTSVPRAPPRVMLGGDVFSGHHSTGTRTGHCPLQLPMLSPPLHSGSSLHC